jgi:Holliday junction resolvasome RuvABC endonuclease subunit
MPRFIAIDPASTVTGWAVFQDERLVAWGVIDSRRVEYAMTFQNVVNRLAELSKKYQFQEVAVEQAVRFEGREIPALKVVCLAIKKWAEPWFKGHYFEYNVSTWKASVVANSKATKAEVAANVRLRFQQLPEDLTEHEYDAIAIGAHHAGVRRLEGMVQ